MDEAVTASPRIADEDWLTRLLRRFDASWLVAQDGLAEDAVSRSGRRRISASDAADQIGRLIDLYRTERGRLVATARRQLGRFAPDAEDVVQEVIRKLCERPPTLRDPAKLVSYTYAALYNETATRGGRAAQEHARRTPAPDGDDPTADDGYEAFADPGPGLDDVVIFHMVMSQALATLSPRERQMIELVDIGGLTEREAAQRMGITIGTAKSYHHAARTRLRDNPDLQQLRTRT